ncbi:MAG: UvrD-helicase domain-containing protein [Phascolarctobacterium sp.]|nr:UvrD-helicase domain-containing protein [Candidatus Phascolarctobacterium caballi]
MENNLLQDKVITVIDNNVAVSAGAGSGKTYSLAKRYVYILLQHLEKNKLNITDIVAVTFTRMAALEMRERVRTFLREEVKESPALQEYLDEFDKAQIVTLDSLQGRILRSHPVEAELDPDFVLLEGEEYEALTNELTRKFLRNEAANNNEYLTELLCYFDLNSLHSYLQKAQRERRVFTFSDEKLLKPYNAEKHTVAAFLHLARQYHDFIAKELSKQNILGHEDVTAKCVKLLKEHDPVRHSYQKQIKYLMVDEFQDTNDAQRELVYLLCGDSNNPTENDQVLSGKKLFVVGDIKQSIYKFRGADVEVFKNVQEAILRKQGERFTRTINYRSTDKILNFVNTIFSSKLLFGDNNFEQLEPANDHISNDENNFEYPVFKMFFPNGITVGRDKKELLVWEAEHVARRIEELTSNGAKYGDIAILLPKMTKVNILIQALVNHHIPYVQLGGRGFYQKQEIYDILNIFKVLHENNLLALIGALRSPYFGLSDIDINNLFQEYYKNKFIKMTAENSAKLCEEFLKLEVCSPLLKLRTMSQHLGMAELWQKVFEQLAVSQILLNQKNGKQLLANVEKMRTLSTTYCENNKCGLTDWLEFLDKVTADSKETEANLPADTVVKIMTIHKSKGLGFPHVILPFLGNSKGTSEQISFDIDTKNGLLGMKIPNTDNASVWEQFKTQNDELEAEEEKRKLYVAITRAKQTLYMSGSANKLEGIENKNDFASLLWLTTHIQIEVPPVGRQKKSRIRWELKPNLVNLHQENVGYFTPDTTSTNCQPIQNNQLPITTPYITNKKTPLNIIFSPSMLQTYLHCQREYFYRYVCGLPSYSQQNITADTNKLSAALQGTIIHTALEHYHGNSEKAFGLALTLCDAKSTIWQPAKIMFENYLQSDIFKQIPNSHERELSFQLPLDNGVSFKGVIDCLYLKDDNTYGIVDYKTGSVPQKLNDGYAMQLAIYSRAVQTLKKTSVNSLALHYLQELKAIEITEDKNLYNQALNLAKEIQEKYAENDFMGNGNCKYCAYNYLCTACRLQQES